MKGGDWMIVEAGSIRLTEKLKMWLQVKGWTQRDLASALNCDESLVSQWLDRRSEKHPSWKKLKEICAMTGLDIGDLMTFDRGITTKKGEEPTNGRNRIGEKVNQK